MIPIYQFLSAIFSDILTIVYKNKVTIDHPSRKVILRYQRISEFLFIHYYLIHALIPPKGMSTSEGQIKFTTCPLDGMRLMYR
jgi:hypothetical protein